MEMAALAAIIQRNICIAFPIASDRGCHVFQARPASTAQTSIETSSSPTRLIWIKLLADAEPEIASTCRP